MKCKTKSSETYVATEEETCLKEERSESVVVDSSQAFFPETKLRSTKEFEMETIILQLVAVSPL